MKLIKRSAFAFLLFVMAFTASAKGGGHASGHASSSHSSAHVSETVHPTSHAAETKSPHYADVPRVVDTSVAKPSTSSIVPRVVADSNSKDCKEDSPKCK